MESYQSADSEKKARSAREAALSYRPQSAPLPKSIAGPVDNEPYQLAALQYFEAAQRFYQDGDATRGDYCIVKGDKYLLLAAIATRANSMGVSPLLEEMPENQMEEARVVTKTELGAKLQHIRDSLAERPRLMPRVPVEEANESQCDYFEETAVFCADEAIAAGDDIGSVLYWLHQGDVYYLLFDICTQIEAMISSS